MWNVLLKSPVLASLEQCIQWVKNMLSEAKDHMPSLEGQKQLTPSWGLQQLQVWQVLILITAKVVGSSHAIISKIKNKHYQMNAPFESIIKGSLMSPIWAKTFQLPPYILFEGRGRVWRWDPYAPFICGLQNHTWIDLNNLIFVLLPIPSKVHPTHFTP